MASPPFVLNVAAPANTDIAANYPTLDRSDKDIIQSWLLIQMNTFGHDNFTLIDAVGSVNGPVSAPTPSAGTAAIYYDSTKVLLQYRGDVGAAEQLGVPIGAVIPFAGSSAPAGYALCFGQAISRTTFANLFALIGSTYGAGDGSTTFNVPDLRGRVVAGKDDMGGSAANRITSGGSGITGTTLGASGGAETHTIVIGEIPSHNHSATDSGHTHGGNAGALFMSTGGFQSGTSGGAQFGNTFTNTASGTANITVGNTGGGNPATVTQPTLMLNYIIKTT